MRWSCYHCIHLLPLPLRATLIIDDSTSIATFHYICSIQLGLESPHRLQLKHWLSAELEDNICCFSLMGTTNVLPFKFFRKFLTYEKFLTFPDLSAHQFPPVQLQLSDGKFLSMQSKKQGSPFELLSIPHRKHTLMLWSQQPNGKRPLALSKLRNPLQTLLYFNNQLCKWQVYHK
jgi:hypothetical protein